MPALNIVPHYPILVEIIENANTRLILAPLPLLPVVGLPLPGPASIGPGTVAALPWRWDPLAGGSPVPTILYSRLQVRPVTPVKVTFPASSPDVWNVIGPDHASHPLILLLRGDGDGVHAELPAVVPGTLPVPLGVLTSLKP